MIESCLRWGYPGRYQTAHCAFVATDWFLLGSVTQLALSASGQGAPLAQLRLEDTHNRHHN